MFGITFQVAAQHDQHPTENQSSVTELRQVTKQQPVYCAGQVCFEVTQVGLQGAGTVRYIFWVTQLHGNGHS